MKSRCWAALLLLLALTVRLPAEEAAPLELEHGQFLLTLQGDNQLLPHTLVYKPGQVSLLRQDTGLNLAFVSFEMHSKIYHDENRLMWPGQQDPRFFTDAKVLGSKLVRQEGFAGVQVDLETSFAKVQRTIWLHDQQPLVRSEYALEMSRDVLVHEAGNLAVGLQLAESFTRLQMLDPQAKAPAVIAADGYKGVNVSAGALTGWPQLAIAPEQKLGVLIISSAAGDLATPPATQMLALKKGQRLTLSLTLQVGPLDDAALAGQLSAQPQPAWLLPFALLQSSAIRARAGQLDQAQADLLRAAELRPEFAAPFALLGGLRRDFKLPGETQAWAAGGYRMPFNYGYLLSASGLAQAAKLEEEQARQHAFNLLIAVETSPFYPDYYIWAARPFLERKMYVQACAMYRQALWALEHAPYAPAKKDKIRGQLQQKLAELEKIITTQTSSELPAPIPVTSATTP